MTENPEVDFIHKMASRMAAADPLHEVLAQIVEFAASVVSCDSCFLYALEEGELILRSSKNAHADVVDRLKLRLGQGITGWVAEHGKPVAVAVNASQDPRFQLFKDLPEDRFEAFLSVPVLCRGRIVGVINLQNREPHEYSEREIMLVSTIGFWWARKSKWRAWRAKTCTSRKNSKPANWSSAPRAFSSANSRSPKRRPTSPYSARAASGANR